MICRALRDRRADGGESGDVSRAVRLRGVGAGEKGACGA
jgi:hypothetical protein